MNDMIIEFKCYPVHTATSSEKDNEIKLTDGNVTNRLRINLFGKKNDGQKI